MCVYIYIFLKETNHNSIHLNRHIPIYQKMSTASIMFFAGLVGSRAKGLNGLGVSAEFRYPDRNRTRPLISKDIPHEDFGFGFRVHIGFVV